MSKGNDAVKLHGEGFNCAQCVLMTCSDLDKETAEKIASGFGGGLKSGEICGAISGAVMSLGLAGCEASEVKKLVKDFRGKFGHVRCIELKGKRKFKWMGKRKPVPCDELIKYAADAVENILEKSNGNL